MNKQSASPLRRDGERRGGDEVERRRRRRRRVLRQRQHPPGRCNETEGKKKRRRDAAVSLAAQCKENSPRPLLGPEPEAAGSEEERLSVPEFTPLRRCLGTGGDAAKSHFTALLGAAIWLRKQGEPIHPLHWQYDQVGPILWCSCCPYG